MGTSFSFTKKNAIVNNNKPVLLADQEYDTTNNKYERIPLILPDAILKNSNNAPISYEELGLTWLYSTEATKGNSTYIYLFTDKPPTDRSTNAWNDMRWVWNGDDMWGKNPGNINAIIKYSIEHVNWNGAVTSPEDGTVSIPLNTNTLKYRSSPWTTDEYRVYAEIENNGIKIELINDNASSPYLRIRVISVEIEYELEPPIVKYDKTLAYTSPTGSMGIGNTVFRTALITNGAHKFDDSIAGTLQKYGTSSVYIIKGTSADIAMNVKHEIPRGFTGVLTINARFLLYRTDLTNYYKLDYAEVQKVLGEFRTRTPVPLSLYTPEHHYDIDPGDQDYYLPYEIEYVYIRGKISNIIINGYDVLTEMDDVNFPLYGWGGMNVPGQAFFIDNYEQTIAFAIWTGIFYTTPSFSSDIKISMGIPNSNVNWTNQQFLYIDNINFKGDAYE